MNPQEFMESSEIMLNIGCGPNGLNHWLNYDWGVLPLLSKFPGARRCLIQLGALPKGYDLPWARLKLVDIRKKIPAGGRRSEIHLLFARHRTFRAMGGVAHPAGVPPLFER